jgi:hypothetical protein
MMTMKLRPCPALRQIEARPRRQALCCGPNAPGACGEPNTPAG